VLDAGRDDVSDHRELAVRGGFGLAAASHANRRAAASHSSRPRTPAAGSRRPTLSTLDRELAGCSGSAFPVGASAASGMLRKLDIADSS